MSGHTLKDKIQNKDIRKCLGVTKIEKKMKSNYLRRFEHVQRQSISKPVRMIESWTSRNLNIG